LGLSLLGFGDIIYFVVHRITLRAGGWYFVILCIGVRNTADSCIHNIHSRAKRRRQKNYHISIRTQQKRQSSKQAQNCLPKKLPPHPPSPLIYFSRYPQMQIHSGMEVILPHTSRVRPTAAHGARTIGLSNLAWIVEGFVEDGSCVDEEGFGVWVRVAPGVVGMG
jgi:hypothetical protein